MKAVYWVAAVCSVILSCWVTYHADIINPDAICYLQSAETIATQGLKAAMQVCNQANWPFYSLLIHHVSQFTRLSVLHSAFLLDGIFSLISVLSFIYCIQLLGGTRRTLGFAAGVILLAHEFNSVREYVIRDHGFWAFYLLSVAAMLRYLTMPSLRMALVWALTLILATLFRVEGAFFLLCLPLIVWFQFEKSGSQRFYQFIQLNALSIVIGAMLVASLFVFDVSNLTRLSEVQFQLLHGVSRVVERFHLSATALAQNVLSPYAAKDAGWILGLLLGIWYTVSVIANVSLIYAALALYAIRQKLLPFNKSAYLVLFAYIVINVLITLGFLIDHMFLSKRYLIALSLILMLWVPYALEHIARLRERKWLVPVTAVFVIAYALGGIFQFGYSKAYISQAGDWLAENVPSDAVIYSNDELVMYYSKHFGNAIFEKAKIYTATDVVSDGRWKQYDYLALRLNKHDVKQMKKTEEMSLSLLQEFANKRGDKVIIYKVLH